MSTPRLAIPELGRVFGGETISGLSEWQLLERYLERRDEAAFEAIVTRHGPMVLGVCRRLLGHSAEAEDAFQATFLVLVRRARDLGPRDAIGPWLHGVASRVARRARGQAACRRRHQVALSERSAAAPGPTLVDPDMLEVLDLELSRLPSKYRSPLVLCYLEGRTHEEAARDLRWPVGTVKGRLSRARDLLRARLTRCGFATPSGVFPILLSADLSSVLDRPLVERTLRSSLGRTAAQAAAPFASVSVTTLAEGVLTAMFFNKLKWAALAAVATGFIFTSVAVLGRQAAGQKADGNPPPSKGLAPPAQPVPSQGTFKVFVPREGGQPAPPGTAVPGLRKKRHATAAEENDGADDPRSRQILQKLDEPIPMPFASETPLDDILKYIKQSTTTPTFAGIPIYVDPHGLQEAERSLNSTVQLDLEGVPLRRTLQLMLTQLGLSYFVEDGILVITSKDSATQQGLPPSMASPPPIFDRLEKAERGELDPEQMRELLELLKLRTQVKRAVDAYHDDDAGRAKSGTDQIGELLKEVRELIQLLKAEKQVPKPVEKK